MAACPAAASLQHRTLAKAPAVTDDACPERWQAPRQDKSFMQGVPTRPAHVSVLLSKDRYTISLVTRLDGE